MGIYALYANFASLGKVALPSVSSMNIVVKPQQSYSQNSRVFLKDKYYIIY